MFFVKYEELCKKAKKTTTGVALELDVSKSTVAYWRANHNVIPKQEVLIKIADYFNVSVDYLLGKTDRRESLDNSIPEKNTIKIAGRDGSYLERQLTDDQLDLIKKMIDQMPPADDL